MEVLGVEVLDLNLDLDLGDGVGGGPERPKGRVKNDRRNSGGTLRQKETKRRHTESWISWISWIPWIS